MHNDSNNSLSLTIPAGPEKPNRTRAKHGIYSRVDSKRLPQGGVFAKTRRELGQLRTELVKTGTAARRSPHLARLARL